MPKKSKLLSALDAHQGRDHELERQKKMQKKAQKVKKVKAQARTEEESESEEDEVMEAGDDEVAGDDNEGGVEYLKQALKKMGAGEAEIDFFAGGADGLDEDEDEDDDDDDDDDDDGDDNGIMVGDIDDSETSSSELDPSDDASTTSDTSIPLSDLSSPGPDILPHHRLTTHNPPALLRALSSIALPLATLPFSAHQSLTTPSPISIADINDDLNRELTFYSQSLSAVKTARALLHREGSTAFTRPADYFAEMVKSDEHMLKIKGKLTDEAASKRASADARKQRDLKKFGKEVQVRKEQERGKERRELGEKIKSLKRKRQGGEAAAGEREEEMFDVALEDAVGSKRGRGDERGRGRDGSRGRGRDARGRGGREKHDGKYGFGGKKRFGKSGDAMSSGDMAGFDLRGMKGGARGARGGRGRGGARGGSQRLGKSRRRGGAGSRG